ncbi:adenosylcobinamide-phosphate synthase CbiB [Herbaspirillum sp. alder98]|uniref:adenosylcobinamide-phosphate synthase CbiB n=1 Tax=Herbaspirillum sp. alder98 TaxID=2913096 RepID=UPI001CD86035|nr:adenosylcobinamide-phosphate synthase CbiB [Herbaspirillum sp. alder98]MCA1326571.1 adenosylcobinamide-phosphate synthase CbiB [Herbaspirillum sp. alder98]
MLSNIAWPWLALLMAAGIALDLLLGETRRWHPLVGFGRMAGAIESRLNRHVARRLRGILAWSVAVLPAVLLADWLVSAAPWWLAALLHALLLYFCLGLRSLRDHTVPIARALAAGDLAQARRLTSYIVSRDTGAADAGDLAKAGVESLLENGNDAVFGTLFWFLVAGGPGALLFRLSNTLDAMWGYRNTRFLHFGWAAARIDDVLNWAPARLTAWSYAWLGDRRRALACWKTQAPAWSSPNAGPVMAAGAGALGVTVGGAAVYEGEIEQRGILGAGPPAQGADIVRAWRLVAGVTALWLALVCLVTLVCLGVSHA